MTKYTNLFTSKKDQVARTPSYILSLAKSLFLPPEVNSFFDPCPPTWNSASAWDALDRSQNWGRFNFVNPPFKEAGRFFQRAIEQEEHAVSVFLVPTRFHTRYFANALPHIRRIVLIDQRIRFVGYETPLQTAMCFVVFGSEHATFPMDVATDDVKPFDVGFYVSPTLRPYLIFPPLMRTCCTAACRNP